MCHVFSQNGKMIAATTYKMVKTAQPMMNHMLFSHWVDKASRSGSLERITIFFFKKAGVSFIFILSFSKMVFPLCSFLLRRLFLWVLVGLCIFAIFFKQVKLNTQFFCFLLSSFIIWLEELWYFLIFRNDQVKNSRIVST